MKKDRRWDDASDFVAAAFAKGSKKIKPEFHGSVAILVPSIVVLRPGADMSAAVLEQFQDGSYVELTEKTTRKEIMDSVGLEIDEDEEKADRAFELLDRMKFHLPIT